MKEPEISIIVPIYNAESFIVRCVNSVLAQSFEDWELILIDDGSSDNSGVICDTMSDNDKRIKVLHKSNGGVSSARNLGLEHAKGTWISFLDVDDYWLPDFLSNMMAHGEYNLIISGSLRFGVSNDDYHIPQTRIYEVKDLLKRCFTQEKIDNIYLSCISYPWGKLFKNDIIQKYHLRYNAKLKLSEDTCFSLQYLEKIDKIIFVEGGCYMYYTTNVQKSHLMMSFEEYKTHVTLVNKIITDVADNFDLNAHEYCEGLCSMYFFAFLNKLTHESIGVKCNELRKFHRFNNVPVLHYLKNFSLLMRVILYAAVYNGITYHVYTLLLKLKNHK